MDVGSSSSEPSPRPANAPPSHLAYGPSPSPLRRHALPPRCCCRRGHGDAGGRMLTLPGKGSAAAEGVPVYVSRSAAGGWAWVAVPVGGPAVLLWSMSTSSSPVSSSPRRGGPSSCALLARARLEDLFGLWGSRTGALGSGSCQAMVVSACRVVSVRISRAPVELSLLSP